MNRAIISNTVSNPIRLFRGLRYFALLLIWSHCVGFNAHRFDLLWPLTMFSDYQTPFAEHVYLILSGLILNVGMIVVALLFGYVIQVIGRIRF